MLWYDANKSYVQNTSKFALIWHLQEHTTFFIENNDHGVLDLLFKHFIKHWTCEYKIESEEDLTHMPHKLFHIKLVMWMYILFLRCTNAKLLVMFWDVLQLNCWLCFWDVLLLNLFVWYVTLGCMIYLNFMAAFWCSVTKFYDMPAIGRMLYWNWLSDVLMFAT